LVAQTLIADEAREAARAIAALLDLGAVGVEDAVVEIGSGQTRRLDQQDLIAADAETPVGQTSREIRRPGRPAGARRRRRRSRCPVPASW
jgi:hypothetical protein